MTNSHFHNRLKVSTIFLLVIIFLPFINAQESRDWKTYPSCPPSGTVYATIFFNGDLIIGGSFTIAGGSVTNNIARWDGSTWVPLSTGTDAIVRTLEVHNGELYIGGDFTRAGGATVANIAKWNGSTWSALGAGVNDKVYTLKSINNELYVGGNFTTAGGSTIEKIAKWNGSTWSAFGGSPNGAVRTICEYNNEIYIGGSFSIIDGVSRNYIAKWDGTTWSPISANGYGASWTVYSIVTDGSNLYVGGDFTTIDQVRMSRVAKWDGTSWSQLGDGVNSTVYSLAFRRSSLFAAGRFTKNGSNNLFYIGEWKNDTWYSLQGGTDGTVYSLTEKDDYLYVGGSFKYVSFITEPKIASYNGLTWIIDRFKCEGTYNGLSNEVSASAVYNDKRIIGGSFNAVGNYIVEETTTSWRQLRFGLDYPVYCMKANGSDLYVGGNFSGQQSSSSLQLNRIAKWNGSTWSALGDGSSGVVGNIEFIGNDLYKTGHYYPTNGETIRNITKWDGNTWSAVGDELDNSVSDLLNWNNQLVAAGYFTSAGTTTLNHIGVWNGSNWTPLGTGMNDDVYTVALHEGELYAGGAFTTAGGITVGGIAKWNGSSWLHPGFTLDVAPQTMASFNGKLYMGGSNFLKVWDGSNLIDIPVNHRVGHLAVFNIELNIGGLFTIIDGQVSSHFAVLKNDITLLPCTHTNVTISDRPMVDNLIIRASGNISTNGSISAGRQATFQANQMITLSPDFESEGELNILIGDCN